MLVLFYRSDDLRFRVPTITMAMSVPLLDALSFETDEGFSNYALFKINNLK